MTVLARLAPEQRRALRVALESERLEPPYTPASLRAYGPADVRAELAQELTRLGALAMTPRQIAEVVRAIEEMPRPPRVALVWTGPEEVGSTSRDTGVVMRELFQQARRSVLVSGFAVYQGKSVFQALAQRMEELPELQVTMFFNIERPWGDDRPAEALLRQFAQRFTRDQWPGRRWPDIFYDPRTLEPFTGGKRASLHAKCVIVDELRVLVTSANFTEAAQERNIEAGVDIADASLAASLRYQFSSLVSTGVLQPLPL